MNEQLFKFCMNCGCKMSVNNKFCTNCGTKLSDVQQNIHPEQATANMNTSQNNEQLQQYELSLGKNYLNGIGTQKNYEQAILHLKKALALDSDEAASLLIITYLYQAIEIIQKRQNILFKGNNMPLNNSINSALNMHTPVNHNSTNTENAHPQNKGNASLAKTGKYVAAAAAGAIASNLLRNDTASAGSRQVYQDEPIYMAPPVPAADYSNQSSAPISEEIQQENDINSSDDESATEDSSMDNTDFSSDEYDDSNASDFAESADSDDGGGLLNGLFDDDSF